MRLYQGFIGVVVATVAALAPNMMCFAASQPEGLADGPGIWMNMWNYPDGSFDAYCQNLHSRGVRNLFVQTSRSNTEAVCHPEKLGPLIDACHKYKIRVIAWSFAELRNAQADADRMIAAARFTSPSGQRIDAIAPDLETDLSAAKVESYSRRLRDVLGATYPMVAVVYSPLNLAPQVANIPWKMLDRYYDVIAPMNYWNSKYKKLDAYDYTRSTIQRVRQLVGRPDVEIHVIGDAMGTNASTILPFMKACQEGEATSASLYPNQRMTAEQMDCIAQYSQYFPVNSRFRLAALRELIRTGTVESPANLDPAQSMSRGDFYKLLVRHIYAGKPQAVSGMTAETAAAFLERNGVTQGASASVNPTFESLQAPMPTAEALKTVAALVDFKSSGHHLKPGNANVGRNGHWFSQPAFASELGLKSQAATKPLSYLDAAQIVLQASSSLR